MNDDNGVWEQLAPGCARRRLPELDVTVGVVIGTDRLLVIDTGTTLRQGARLRAEIQELTGRAPTDVVLTHGHFDHVFGAPSFTGMPVHGAAGLGAYLTGQRDELAADAVRHGVPAQQAAESAGALRAPDAVVDRPGELDLGDRAVLLVPLGPAHSGHDLAVVVPGTPGVVFCGDLVEESGEPQAGPDAVCGRWPGALDRLLEAGGETARYVPGHGATVDARFVRAQRDALARRFAGH